MPCSSVSSSPTCRASLFFLCSFSAATVLGDGTAWASSPVRPHSTSTRALGMGRTPDAREEALGTGAHSQRGSPWHGVVASSPTLVQDPSAISLDASAAPLARRELPRRVSGVEILGMGSPAQRSPAWARVPRLEVGYPGASSPAWSRCWLWTAVFLRRCIQTESGAQGLLCLTVLKFASMSSH